MLATSGFNEKQCLRAQSLLNRQQRVPFKASLHKVRCGTHQNFGARLTYSYKAWGTGSCQTSFIILPVDKRNNNWSSLVNGINFPQFFFFFSKISPKDEMVSKQQQMFQCLMNLWALQCHVFFQESRKKPVCSVHLSPHAGMVQGSPQSPDVIPPVTNDVPSPRWALVPPHRGLQQVRSKKGGHPNHTDGVMQSCPSQLLAEHNQREPLLQRQQFGLQNTYTRAACGPSSAGTSRDISKYPLASEGH